MPNKLKIIFFIIFISGLLILTKVIYQNRNTRPVVPQITTALPFEGVVYENAQYGFSFSLPISWKGYLVIEDKWLGDAINAQGEVELGTVSGPKISIRHPLWTEKNPRQDIPVMVFTIKQWTDLQNDVFHVGAAPINPSELGRNNNYIFGLPARYNFAYQTGFEEVDKIVQGKSFVAF